MAATLVLLPGLDGTGELFAPLRAALGPGIAAVVIRYPDSPLGYAALADLAAAALPQGRLVLLGESFSGPIALSLARRSPGRVAGCILCASFVCSPRRALRWVAPLAGLLRPERVPGWLADGCVMGRFATPELRRLHAAALRQLSAATLAARLRAIASVDVREVVRELPVPVLYLRATEDRLVPKSAATRFARVARLGRISDIEGPHFLLQARPVAAAEVILRFMAGLPA